MKNVLFYISDITQNGGTERAASIIVNQLAKDPSLRIFLISAYGKQLSGYFEISKNVSVFFLKCEGRPIKNLLYINIRILRFISTYSIDFVVSNEVMSIFFTLPTVFFSYQKLQFIVWDHFNFNVNLGKRGRTVARQLSAKYADIIVTLTEMDKMLWTNNLKPKARVVSIPNPSPFQNIENPYSLNSKKVISIGRLTMIKGFDMLVDIWSILTRKYSVIGWEQYIIGDGEEEMSLRNKISSLGLNDFIRIVPSTKKIQDYYKSAAFIVITSRTEGLPMTLIEAQQFGLPAISFFDPDVMYGTGEIIVEGTGELVAQYDLEGFADKMYEMMSNKDSRCNYSSNSFKNSTKYSHNEVLSLWMKIFS